MEPAATAQGALVALAATALTVAGEVGRAGLVVMGSWGTHPGQECSSSRWWRLPSNLAGSEDAARMVPVALHQPGVGRRTARRRARR